MNCSGPLKVKFCRFPRGELPIEAYVPDQCSLESACVPIYLACTSPVPCLPCSFAELHFKDPNDAMHSAMLACQRRYFGEVWSLVFGQLFSSDDGDEARPEAESEEPQPEASGSRKSIPAASAASGERKYFTMSHRPIKESLSLTAPMPELTSETPKRKEKMLVRPAKRKTSFAAQGSRPPA